MADRSTRSSLHGVAATDHVGTLAGIALTPILTVTLALALTLLAPAPVPAQSDQTTAPKAQNKAQPARPGQPAKPAKPGRDTRAALLNQRFAALKRAPDKASARKISAQIWQLWLSSGDVRIDKLVREAQFDRSARDFQNALTKLALVVRERPKYAEGYNQRAIIYFMMREYDRSLADIRATLRLEPRHYGALAGRGLIHMAREKWADALRAYEAAMVVYPYLPAAETLVPILRKRIGQQKI
ncbi:MAG: hypothetical protein AAFR04_12945 [Pseudomonadota bacterium]